MKRILVCLILDQILAVFSPSFQEPGNHLKAIFYLITPYLLWYFVDFVFHVFSKPFSFFISTVSNVVKMISLYLYNYNSHNHSSSLYSNVIQLHSLHVLYGDSPKTKYLTSLNGLPLLWTCYPMQFLRLLVRKHYCSYESFGELDRFISPVWSLIQQGLHGIKITFQLVLLCVLDNLVTLALATSHYSAYFQLNVTKL